MIKIYWNVVPRPFLGTAGSRVSFFPEIINSSVLINTLAFSNFVFKKSMLLCYTSTTHLTELKTTVSSLTIVYSGLTVKFSNM